MKSILLGKPATIALMDNSTIDSILQLLLITKYYIDFIFYQSVAKVVKDKEINPIKSTCNAYCNVAYLPIVVII